MNKKRALPLLLLSLLLCCALLAGCQSSAVKTVNDLTSQLDVTDPDLALYKNEGTTVLRKGGSVTYYISNTHFEFCRLNLSGKMPLPSGRMLLLTPLGECALHWDGESMTLAPFSTVIVPAALEGAVIEGNTKVLMSSLPDRDALREELGYRAENVAGLMD